MNPFGQTQIVITLTAEGQFKATGPFDNKLLCYGLLDMCRDAVQKHDSQRRVEPASATILRSLVDEK